MKPVVSNNFWTKIFSMILSCLVFSTSLLPMAHASGEVALNLSPSTGTFVIDSTFDVPIYLDTENQSINAVELTVKFQPDKLQLISSSTGKSIIGIWPTLPKFNNETGIVNLVGGVPGGITASKGLITTLTFRVKSVGTTVVKIDSSRVLFNDGSGTEALVRNNGAIYQLTLPPPAGPIVASSTHPEQGKWYRSATVSLEWQSDSAVDGYSYMISDQALDTPDDVSDGTQSSITYKNVADGRHYFHIKSLRNNQWGGTTHFALNVDTTLPADFKPEVIPSAKTARTRPVIQFGTTDATSGIDHYELSLIPLNQTDAGKSNQSFFIEAESPYVTGELQQGSYDVIIRAFDLAGNMREVTERIQIVPALFQNIADKGLVFRSSLVIPWWLIWILAGLLILLLGFVAYRFKKRHDHAHAQLSANTLSPDLVLQLEELQRYRERYGKALVVLLLLAASLFLAGNRAKADETKVLNPPIITTIAKNISNEDIFYAGGNAGIPNADVVLLLQNKQTGETFQEDVTSDANGQWFYRHNTFLTPGEYVFWGQVKQGGQVSAPSPETKFTVEKKALQIGSAKFSYTTLYLLIILLLLVICILLFGYIYYHHRKTKKKKQQHRDNLRDARESIRRGFSLVSRDIQEELALIHNARLTKRFGDEEAQREEILLRDLEQLQEYIGQEIWENRE